VIDHLALIRHLALVREIVDARKFAVIIPTAGMTHAQKNLIQHRIFPLTRKTVIDFFKRVFKQRL
jgi:hypothetical protein